MDVVPISDNETSAYRWTYVLRDTEVSSHELRAAYSESCADRPEFLIAVRMGEIERQLRNAAWDAYGYDWDFQFDTCSTPDPQRDPTIVLLQLKKLASRIGGCEAWRNIAIPPEIPPHADAIASGDKPSRNRRNSGRRQ
jgi:hypothetical protein